jgi:hypothetical protein
MRKNSRYKAIHRTFAIEGSWVFSAAKEMIIWAEANIWSE